MALAKVFGYTDKISLKAGDTVQFYVTADGTRTADAQLVRLVHGDENPAGPGFIEESIECEANGAWRVEKQFTQMGSYLEVADPGAKLVLDGSLTLVAFICPNRPQAGHPQTLLSRWDEHRKCGYSLGIDKTGRLEFRLGHAGEVTEIQADRPLHRRIWYFVAATFDAGSGRATLYQEGVVNRYNSLVSRVAALPTNAHATELFRFRQTNLAETPFLVAGARDRSEVHGTFVSQIYCGKIDRPGVFDRALARGELDDLRRGKAPPSRGLVAYWDTTAGYSDRGIGDAVTDMGPFGLHARGYNRPVRGQTGWNWSGRNDCFRMAPQEYGGIEFHADQLVDCNWKVTKSLTLPDSLRSGIYAMRLRAGDGKGLGEEHIVFFVSPRRPTARIAFIAPTASYVASGNDQLPLDAWVSEIIAGRPAVLAAQDLELHERGEFGLSVNETWADGTDVCYSSYHRPLMNMRPKYRHAGLGLPWGLSADLSIIAWLEHKNYDYDVLTDEDLERDGAQALKPYRCVLSGTHPEYYSEAMLDATEDYIAGGGRYIYTGGHGYACNVAFRADEPWVLECRKFGEMFKISGARPGEYYMATNGQAGGGWKMLGRPSQKVVGVGFIAQGFDSTRPYRLMPDSYHQTVSWITKGIKGEIVGDFGLAYGGAAGSAHRPTRKSSRHPAGTPTTMS